MADAGDARGLLNQHGDVFRAQLVAARWFEGGGSISGNLCFSVKKTDVASLLLVVEPAFSFRDVERFFRVR